MNRAIGVCIIEDSIQWLLRLQHLLVEAGGLHFIGSARDVAGARRLIAERQPQIVILDLLLSNGTGVDVLRAIRRLNSRTPNSKMASSKMPDSSIRVVVVTGAPCPEIKDACLALGADHFFDKALELDGIQGALVALQRQIALEEAAEQNSTASLSILE
jgi:DNA-binding NarL/FixJ family response regulator